MATWLVTGANRGLGLGLAEHLLARGDRVVAGTRDPLGAEALQRLAARHPALELLPLDVTDAASVAAAKATLGARPIDVLVNNAGVYAERGKGALEADPEAFLATLAVNSVAPIRMIKALADNLTPGAKVVTISSRMGSLTLGSTGEFVYRASKAAVNKAIQAIAPELAGRGVTAVVMHPGWVRTDMGGRGADLEVGEATAGLMATIDRLTPKDAGTFLNWNGEPIPW